MPEESYKLRTRECVRGEQVKIVIGLLLAISTTGRQTM